MELLVHAVTLEDWSDLLYRSAVGCKKYPLEAQQYRCVSDDASPIVGPLFFLSISVLGNMILLNLTVAVIVQSHDKATLQIRAEEEIEAEERRRKIREVLLQRARSRKKRAKRLRQKLHGAVIAASLNPTLSKAAGAARDTDATGAHKSLRSAGLQVKRALQWAAGVAPTTEGDAPDQVTRQDTSAKSLVIGSVSKQNLPPTEAMKRARGALQAAKAFHQSSNFGTDSKVTLSEVENDPRSQKATDPPAKPDVDVTSTEGQAVPAQAGVIQVKSAGEPKVRFQVEEKPPGPPKAPGLGAIGKQGSENLAKAIRAVTVHFDQAKSEVEASQRLATIAGLIADAAIALERLGPAHADLEASSLVLQAITDSELRPHGFRGWMVAAAEVCPASAAYCGRTCGCNALVLDASDELIDELVKDSLCWGLCGTRFTRRMSWGQWLAWLLCWANIDAAGRLQCCGRCWCCARGFSRGKGISGTLWGRTRGAVRVAATFQSAHSAIRAIRSTSGGDIRTQLSGIRSPNDVKVPEQLNDDTKPGIASIPSSAELLRHLRPPPPKRAGTDDPMALSSASRTSLDPQASAIIKILQAVSSLEGSSTSIHDPLSAMRMGHKAKEQGEGMTGAAYEILGQVASDVVQRTRVPFASFRSKRPPPLSPVLDQGDEDRSDDPAEEEQDDAKPSTSRVLAISGSFLQRAGVLSSVAAPAAAATSIGFGAGPGGDTTPGTQFQRPSSTDVLEAAVADKAIKMIQSREALVQRSRTGDSQEETPAGTAVPVPSAKSVRFATPSKSRRFEQEVGAMRIEEVGGDSDDDDEDPPSPTKQKQPVALQGAMPRINTAAKVLAAAGPRSAVAMQKIRSRIVASASAFDSTSADARACERGTTTVVRRMVDADIALAVRASRDVSQGAMTAAGAKFAMIAASRRALSQRLLATPRDEEDESTGVDEDPSSDERRMFADDPDATQGEEESIKELIVESWPLEHQVRVLRGVRLVSSMLLSQRDKDSRKWKRRWRRQAVAAETALRLGIPQGGEPPQQQDATADTLGTSDNGISPSPDNGDDGDDDETEP
jgi:hypothetical protein